MNREEATRRFLEITFGREDAAKVIARCGAEEITEAGILRLRGVGNKSCRLILNQLKLVQELAGEVHSADLENRLSVLEARLKAVENRLGTF